MAREDLSGRGKVGETYRSGKFKKARAKGLKTSDLSKAQLKRAQTARGKKVSQKSVKRATRNVANISETQFEKGRGVTRNGKLFTGQVKLASGKMATYVKGRRVVAGPKKKPATGGRGVSGGRGSGSGTQAKPSSTSSRVTNTTASRIGGYTPGTRLPGSGSDGVNAKTSEGSARTSDYVHDSFSSWSRGRTTPGKDIFGNQTANTIGNNPYKTGRSPSNRPIRGKKSRLQMDANGNMRWVKVV